MGLAVPPRMLSLSCRFLYRGAVQPGIAAGRACARPLNPSTSLARRRAHMRTLEELADEFASAPFAFSASECRRPVDPRTIDDLESRFGVRLPTDVRAFYSRMDGTDMMDAAHGLITLWPLNRWSRLDDEVSQHAREVPGDAIVFADHSAWCWAYAAEFDAESERMVVSIVGAGPGIPIAETFTEFLELIVTDSKRLYGEAG